MYGDYMPPCFLLNLPFLAPRLTFPGLKTVSNLPLPLGILCQKTRAFSRKGYEPNSPVFFALGFFVLTWTMEPGPSLCLLGTVAWA